MIHICQCLCPARHCIEAAAYDPAYVSPADAARRLMHNLARAIYRHEIDPWCAICRAPVERWTYEHGRTRFATIAEATPALLACQADQLASRARLEGERN